MESVISEIILGIIGVLLTGLGTIITYLINKYIKNDKLKTIVNNLNELVKTGVNCVYQVYVETLKKDNMFDANAQKEALSLCLEYIEKNMPADIKEYLDNNYENIRDYLTGLIESTIAKCKRGDK